MIIIPPLGNLKEKVGVAFSRDGEMKLIWFSNSC